MKDFCTLLTSFIYFNGEFPVTIQFLCIDSFPSLSLSFYFSYNIILIFLPKTRKQVFH